MANWRRFLRNHVPDLVSVDFFTVPAITFRVLFVCLDLAADRRRVLRSAVANLGLKQVLTAVRAPGQNPYVERVIGSIRWECLDHTIVLGEYFQYYHRWRVHPSLEDSPDGRPVQPPEVDDVIQIREVGGLHHHYERKAA